MIEIRAFREMALGADARDAAIYQGKSSLETAMINFKDIVKKEEDLAIGAIGN